MTYFIGTNPTDVVDSFIKRYFYGLRRNVDGELYLVILDQLSGIDDAVTINDYGLDEDNFNGFEEGINFVEGIDENHDIVHANLRYQQFRWDTRYVTYYIDDNGIITLRINQAYEYPTDVSAPGY